MQENGNYGHFIHNVQEHSPVCFYTKDRFIGTVILRLKIKSMQTIVLPYNIQIFFYSQITRSSNMLANLT